MRLRTIALIGAVAACLVAGAGYAVGKLTTDQASTAAPGAINLAGVSASAGSSFAFAKADHVHSITGQLPAANVNKDATLAGTTSLGIDLTHANTWTGIQTLTGSSTQGNPILTPATSAPSAPSNGAYSVWGSGQGMAATVTLNGANAQFAGMPHLNVSTAAGQSIPNNSETTVVYGTVSTNTTTTQCAGSANCYNSSTGVFTVPPNMGGIYAVTCAIGWNAGFTGRAQVIVAKTGVDVAYFARNSPASQFDSAIVTYAGSFAAGDTIVCKALQVSGGPISLAAIGTGNYFNVNRLSD